MTTPTSPQNVDLGRARWEAERAFREREIALVERAQAAREAELELKRKERALSQWSNPLIVATLAASIAAIGTTAVAYLNARSNLEIQSERSEQARILEMIKTGDSDKAAANLDFLLQAGLVNDPDTRSRLDGFLRSRKVGTGPTLPNAELQREFDRQQELLKETERTVEEIQSQRQRL